MCAWPAELAAFVQDPSGKRLDIAAYSIANSFRRAESERGQALNDASVPDAPIGTDVQYYKFWRNRQEWLSTAYADFACRKDPDDGYALFTGPTYYHGRASIPIWEDYTWGQFCESAQCGTVASGKFGFRRATQWDPDVNDWTNFNDPMYTAAGGGGFGLADVGDILGPWIAVDLYRMYNELVWVAHFGADENPTWEDSGREDQRAWTEEQAGNYIDAKAAAEAAWIETTDEIEDWPRCVTIMHAPDVFPAPLVYVATILRRQFFARITGTATHCKKSCDWYAKTVRAELPAYCHDPEWDRYGDCPDGQDLLEGLWSLWRADAPEQTDPADFDSSVALGRYNGARGCPVNEAGSDWAADPMLSDWWPDYPTTIRGWEAPNGHSDLVAVLRWDVDGGFDYVEPAP